MAAPGIEPRDTTTTFPSTAVFENLVVNQEDFSVDESMRSADHIYLSLSGPFLKQYALVAGSTIQVDVQFQIDRQIFNEWHYALDELVSPKLIFPDTFLETNLYLMTNIRELTSKYPEVEYVRFFLILSYSLN